MHIHIKKVPDTIDGFLHSFTSDGRVKIKVSFGVTSDKPEFYKYMEEISAHVKSECALRVVI